MMIATMPPTPGPSDAEVCAVIACVAVVTSGRRPVWSVVEFDEFDTTAGGSKETDSMVGGYATTTVTPRA